MTRIPVIDLFAGPGGLGEGFSSFRGKDGKKVFDVALSIEKDPHAHRTLELRSFFRKFPEGQVPDEYYEYIQKKSLTERPREQADLRRELFEKFPKESELARREAWHAELGNENDNLNDRIDAHINDILNSRGATCWGIIGGPPCQAYSVIGRSRNKGKIGYTAEKDKRTYLYQQYLRVIAKHKPDFFIMENVKGMLSAKLNGRSLFEQILDDLRFPGKDTGSPGESSCDFEYLIYPLASSFSKDPLKASDFIVEAEQYGVPQARHRVILMGIRKDFSSLQPSLLKKHRCEVKVKDVLHDLPKLRSGLSREKKENNTWDNWAEKVWEIVDLDCFNDDGCERELTEAVSAVAAQICENSRLSQGSEYFHVPSGEFTSEKLAEWYQDKRLAGVCNHTCRGHMVSDLHRYLYAAVFAGKHGKSPLITEFPEELIPAHANARSGHFNDRFRVQIAGKPSTTVTSHIAKDGHFFIHYDPEQCRSLTVREAARLQTFPDNYFFEGPRTQQYIQVGNAVPPLLAKQIAEVLYDLIERTFSLNK